MTDKRIEIAAGIPKQVAEAILAAMGDMPSLRKGDRNAYAKYDFVGIDTFLEKIPPIAAKHGIFWQPRELNYEIVGKDNNYVATTYAFDLMYKDGTCLPEYGKITVIHPIQGAQTAGSSLAYAEKMFCRFAFKIVTGEEDADATDNTKVTPIRRPEVQLRQAAPVAVPAGPATGSPVEPMGEIVGGIAAGGVKVTEEDGVPIIAAPADPARWDVAAAVFHTFVPQCQSAEELKGFWTKNIAALDKMQAQAPDTYKGVKDAFTKHKAELKAKEKK